MAKQFLITRPNYDKETSYIHSFSKEVVDLAKNNDKIHMTKLEYTNVTRKNFEKAINKNKPRLVFLNGHGDENIVMGHKDESILDKNNAELMNKKIVYALACESLSKLGKISVEKGAHAYVGYKKEFKWVVDPSRISVPDKDKNAAPFKKVCFVLGKNLLSSIPVGEAIEQTKKEYKALIRNYGRSTDNFGDAPLIGLMLSWNLMFLGMHGNSNISF